MAIKNKRLKDYVFSNTSATIRSRGNSLNVDSLVFSLGKDRAEAIVMGTEKYEVLFKGLESDTIHSACTCPYDYGGLCKHQVAVANEIDFYLDTATDTTIAIVSDYYNPEDDTYKFSKQQIKDFTDEKLVSLTKKSIYNQSLELYIENTTKDKGGIIFNYQTSYWSDIYIKCSVKIINDNIILNSICKCQKRRLCKHHIATINALQNEYKYLLSSEEEIYNIKETLLEEYGFSQTSDNYKKYFEFKIKDGEYLLEHKVKGIINESNLDILQDFKEQLITSDKIISEALPVAKKEKKKKPYKIVFGLHFSGDKKDFYVLPIKGNTNKNGEISTFIKEIDYRLLINEETQFTQEETEQIKLALQLSQENSSYTINGNYFSEKIRILRTLVKSVEPNSFCKLKAYDYYDNIKKKNLQPIVLKNINSDLSFTVKEEENFFVTTPYLKIGKRAKLSAFNNKNNLFFSIKKDNWYLHKNLKTCNVVRFFSQAADFRVLKKNFEKFKQNVLVPLGEEYPVTYSFLPKTSKVKHKGITFKKQLYLSKVEDYILFKPAISIENQIAPLYSSKKIVVTKNKKEFEIERNSIQEKEFDQELRSLHLEFENQNNDFFFLSEEKLLENFWFLNLFDTLKELNIEVFGKDDLNLKYNQNKPTISINVASEIDWFDVNIQVSFGDQQVNLRDLKKNIINKDKYIKLNNGSIGILPEEWLEKYLHLFRTGNVKKNGIEVSKYQFSVIDTLYEELEDDTNLFDEHLKIKEKLHNFDGLSPIRKPRGVKATLRPYQKEGLKWLNFLDDFNLGGCLADDMGLGKTLQIITFIKHLKSKHKTNTPHLVVVPTSLVFNWKEEVAKFCPELKMHLHIGLKRNKKEINFNDFDIILTTYGLVINDIELLRKITFQYVILDESQAIKNPVSKRYKAVKLLKSTNKLVLTGTPIENNTFDLYAQMNFVNPGLLGGVQQFKNNYANAIDKDKDTKVATELKNLIDPFLLRRTKEQVATDLPAKTEQLLYCTMGNAQRKVYDAFKNKYRDYLMGKIEEEGVGKSKMYVLEGLTKLRQICNSPSLLNEDEEYSNESVKLDLLVNDVLENTGNHKILVFSFFTSMLQLIKNRLDAENITYEYLDGKTKNRQQRVDNFQENEEIRVFLISLKAGGTGLNLTAADYVYIVDPWWNPAVEAQAIDRCYRIGQKKNVTAYKMICKDTIEEKIMELQQSKKQVSQDLIQTDESFVKALDKDKIKNLFQ